MLIHPPTDVSSALPSVGTGTTVPVRGKEEAPAQVGTSGASQDTARACVNSLPHPLLWECGHVIVVETDIAKKWLG